MPKKNERKVWPTGCIWPEPLEAGFGDYWEAEDVELMEAVDEDIRDLLEIKEYMDALVEDGRLCEDYSLNEDYDSDSDDSDEDEAFEPDLGIDYWDDGFDIDAWTEDLTDHMNLIKLPLPSPAEDIRRLTGYEFVNENLLRQAFTRRSFGLEYQTGDSENLEFLGDNVLNTVVTREIIRQLTEVNTIKPSGPFSSRYNEGDFSKIRQHYVSRDYLSARAALLGLDKYILYGSGEQPDDGSREDMMEALIGAVAVDSGWDWKILEDVTDRLICIQLTSPDRLLKATYFDLFNAWHQKHFRQMPVYELYPGRLYRTASGGSSYGCAIRFLVPDNDKGIRTDQRIDVEAETRSGAREMAAEFAYRFVVNHGLWLNLKDAGIEPCLEDAINQLQELYQKKYIDDKPVYTFEECPDDNWACDCVCADVDGWGKAASKTKAKKKAAFMVLKKLFLCVDGDGSF